MLLLWPDKAKGVPNTLAAKDRLYDVAWSPDGLSLATVSDTWAPCAQLWDAVTGRIGQGVGGTSNAGRAVAWSADGKTLASGNLMDFKGRLVPTLKLWNSATGAAVRSMEMHPDRPTSIAWALDGNTVASDGDSHSVHVWDSATGVLKYSLGTIVLGRVGPVAWSPAGDQIAALWNNELHCWNLGNGSTFNFPRGDSLSHLAWSPRDPILAAADRNTVSLFDMKTGTLKTSLEGHVKLVTALAWSRDGTALASGGDDGVILVREAANLSKYRILSQSGRVTALAWSADGKNFAAASPDGAIRLWGRDGGDGAGPKVVLSGHSGGTSNVCWLPDGGGLATVGQDGWIRVWDAASGDLMHAYRSGVEYGSFSPDGDRIAQSTGAWTMRMTETATGRPLGTAVLLRQGAVVLSEDGHYRCENTDVEKELVYVTLTGPMQTTLTPEEFAQKHKWENQPARARLDTALKCDASLLWRLWRHVFNVPMSAGTLETCRHNCLPPIVSQLL